MNEIAKLINLYWRKALWPLFKYSMILGITVVVGFGLTKNVLIPSLTKESSDPNKVTTKKNSAGVGSTVFGKDKTPRTFEDEMTMAAPQLIYQNQSRYYAQEDGAVSADSQNAVDPAVTGEHEDLTVGADVQPSERARLRKLVQGFLVAWEGYRVGTSPAAYRESLTPYVVPDSLDNIALRIDNRQPAAISIDGVSGSQAYRPNIYMRYLQMLRYDGRTAYASLTAPVEYTGPSQTWSGRSFNRTYAFVFQRFGGDWRIARVAAQTLGEVEHYTPG
jgi:hypothetical protein